MSKKIKVTLLKGLAGIRRDHVATVKGLGLKRINHTLFPHDALPIYRKSVV